MPEKVLTFIHAKTFLPLPAISQTMKPFQVLTLALAILMLAPLAQAQSIEEPRFVNKFLGDFSTPSIVPGHRGTFSLTVNHPDAVNLTSPMENVSLSISIYQYATLEESLPVSSIDNPPGIVEADNQPDMTVNCGNIQPGSDFPVTFTIDTQKNTPHGSYFSQSTYFVRFILTFTYDNQNYTMASRGHFNDTQWIHLTETETGAGEINQTYLAELGYDGIIPDSAFSLKIPIPKWPFYGLVGLTGLVGFMAFASYVLDNPGAYPKLEVRLLRLSGRLDIYRRSILKKLRR